MVFGFPLAGYLATLWSGIPFDSMMRLSPLTVMMTLFWPGASESDLIKVGPVTAAAAAIKSTEVVSIFIQ